ncbi:TolC family outer membrane protein [Pandoraea bronchicola]|uniref:Channel protein TolC n=1 Tax=Pandoraea bronchicola TaxID=2508287 RepID=A0A5E5BUE5_9BURK|nr:TolC family outer membrane protein [Pandoraea bronchicola]VVE89439.1 channel protein TolC [Pandoraea bronchicola]
MRPSRLAARERAARRAPALRTLSASALVMATTLAALMVHAAPAGATDLLQLYSEAQSRDALIASARSAYLANIEALPQARAALLPQVSARWGSVNTHYGSGNVSNTFVSSGYSLALTQPIFHWDSWQSYQQGKLTVASAEASFAQAEQDLILRVATAYFDVLAAQDDLALAGTHKQAIAEQLASAKRNFEVGNATIVDTNEAQASFDQATAQEIAAQNTLDVRRAAFARIVGHPVGSLATLRAGATLPSPQPNNVADWVAQAEQANYGVQLQTLTLETARRETSKAKSGYMPSVDLVAAGAHSNVGNANSLLSSAMSSPSSPGSGPSSAGQIGIQISIPIFSGGAVQSKLRQTLALEDKAMTDLDDARRLAVFSARQSYLGVSSGLAQVKALEAAEQSAQSSVASNKLGYQVGIRINADVLNAEDKLFTTRRDLAKARYSTLLSSLQLKASAATLVDTDLQLLNALLTENPEASAAMAGAREAAPADAGAGLPARGVRPGVTAPSMRR